MNETQSNQKELKEAQAQAAQAAATAAAAAIDETFGAGTAWTLSGDVDKATGQAMTHAGDVLDDPGMVVKGAGLDMYGTAEHIEGKLEHDYASAQVEIDGAIASLKADVQKLNDESARSVSAAGTEASADIQAKLDAAKAKQQAIELRIKAATDQAQAQTNARIASLQQQAAQATGAAKAAIEDNIAQMEYDNQQFADYLNKAIAENTMAL